MGLGLGEIRGGQKKKHPVSGWPSKIANLVGVINWLSASKPLKSKIKVGGSK